jgi:LuxR family maltose regulon positive regulatory protein
MTGPSADAPDPVPLPLVWSKLQAPVRRRQMARPGLVQRCMQAEARLTLVRAPAGWGKSTLLAEWSLSPHESRRFAWLTLDRDDNDPVRFWSYFVHALRTGHPVAGTRSLATLAAPRANVVDDVLPLLFSELESLSDPIVLVLDDYHLVTNPAIDAALAYLVEHLPACLVLAIASRSEPPLPLARMRARGELVEIDAGQLGFTEEETDRLFNDLNALGLGPAAVARLRERTEGWAAGLYLAALSLRDRADREDFVRRFAGDDRHVVDYLREEVMSGLPDGVRDFLRRTAHLERLCADLCDAVTERRDSARVLRELEASNAFLVPLDSRREWYRYHHLFGQLLRHQLHAGGEEDLPALHRRASIWYRDHGFASEAIRHATAAGDVADAARLILDHWIEARDRARLETVLSWVDALPEDAVRADPRLCLVLATTLQEVGRVETADRWLDLAARGASLDALTAGPASVASGVAACRAINCYFAGDATGILEAVGSDLDSDDGSGYWRSALLTTAGTALFVTGRPEEADAALRRAIRLGEDSGHFLALIHALGWFVVVQAEQGMQAPARSGLERIDRLVGEHPGLTGYYGSAMAHVARGLLADGPDRAGRAESQLRRGVELARRGEARFEEAYALLALARLLPPPDAAPLLDQARAVLRLCPDPGRLVGLVDDERRTAGRGTWVAAARLPHGQALSDRELAVLRLLPTTQSQREIGRQLHLSFNTVKTHVRSIFRKLEVAARQDAVARARDLGLL